MGHENYSGVGTLGRVHEEFKGRAEMFSMCYCSPS